MEFEIVERVECPVCSSRDRRKLFTIYDDRYGQPDLYTVLECQRCKACYLREAIVPDQISGLYEKYYGYSSNGPSSTMLRRSSFPWHSLSFVRRLEIGKQWEAWYGYWTRNRALDWQIVNGERVLDVGCGYGHTAKHVVARGAHWTGLEVDIEACQAIRGRGLECIHGLIETADLPNEAYDVLIASQVIEHSSEPRTFMKNCARVLRPGGRLFLNTPNSSSRYRLAYGQAWIHWFVPYHQVLFSPQSLECLGQSCGFLVRAYRTETPTHWANLQRGYSRPLRGEAGAWANKNTPGMLQPSVSSLKLRLGDLREGSGDALVAELVR